MAPSAKRQQSAFSGGHLPNGHLRHLLVLHVTPAHEGDRSQTTALSQAVQEATGQSVTLAWVDQGYTGEQAAQEAAQEAAQDGIEFEVVKLPEAKKGCCCPEGG